MKRKRLIMVGRWELIEPLGILHLLGLAKTAEWECEVFLVKDSDFAPLFELARSFKPDLIGFSVWTGWHQQSFDAADQLRSDGFVVAIGGPHATYSTEKCHAHADFVVKGDGFRSFRLILEAIEGKRTLQNGVIHNGHTGKENDRVELVQSIIFDHKRMADGFPIPDRELVYQRYPHLANSPIKSIMCSEGCPFTCSYCYAPHFNELYGGFELTMRPVSNVIAEAIWIRDNYGAKMIYMQDDIFGYQVPWLKEFAPRWKKEVGLPFHCQIRLELTRSDERLKLIREAGCTGVTLAIEHGDAWMRRFVLDRHMKIEDITSGMEKLKKLGFKVRTEQIYGVPFSTIDSDLETLKMNAEFPGLTMFWSSILAPYLGTLMGTIASRMGFYRFNNDDLEESFFARSVMTYNEGGRAPFKEATENRARNEKDKPLGKLYAKPKGDLAADVYHDDETAPIGEIHYLDELKNRKYCDQMVILQRLSNFFVRVSKGPQLAEEFVKADPWQWNWLWLGKFTETHLLTQGLHDRFEGWRETFAGQMKAPWSAIPPEITDGVFYFAHFPAGAELARKFIEADTLRKPHQEMWDEVQSISRRHLFHYALYELDRGEEQIAKY